MNICNTCGLPKELCVCESIAKETQQITIMAVKKKFGKLNTVIEGIDTKQIDHRELTKKLKNAFACGGTFKEGRVELQGDHKNRVKEELMKLGFPPETIQVK
jgi:translation initiation factor 1